MNFTFDGALYQVSKVSFLFTSSSHFTFSASIWICLWSFECFHIFYNFGFDASLLNTLKQSCEKFFSEQRPEKTLSSVATRGVYFLLASLYAFLTEINFYFISRSIAFAQFFFLSFFVYFLLQLKLITINEKLHTRSLQLWDFVEKQQRTNYLLRITLCLCKD